MLGRGDSKLSVRSVEASREKNDDDCAENVLTDNRDETWHSGGPAPAHIDLDLGETKKVSHVDLLPFQVPTPAKTQYRLWAGDAVDSLELVHEADIETTHHKWVHGLPVDREARIVRVEVKKGEGWVALSGANVYGS